MDEQIKQAVSFPEWQEQGRVLSKADGAHRWALADWLAAGDTQWGGTAYNEAQLLFPDHSRKYLYEIAYVARNVTFPVRQESLTFTHHQLVAAMEPADQVRWLKKAVEQKFSATRLRGCIAMERMTESPFAVPLPVELFEKLKLLGRATGLSAEALVVKAVLALMEQSAEEVKKQAEVAVAEETKHWQDRDVAKEKSELLQKAQRESEREWTERAQKLQEIYIQERLPEGCEQRKTEAFELAKTANAIWATAKKALAQSPEDEALRSAEFEAEEALDSARQRFEEVSEEYRETCKPLRTEAEVRYPAKPPKGIRARAQAMRWAASTAVSEARFAEETLSVKKQLAEEAEQLAKEAEAKVTPEALENEFAEVARGPVVKVTPSLFAEMVA